MVRRIAPWERRGNEIIDKHNFILDNYPLADHHNEAPASAAERPCAAVECAAAASAAAVNTSLGVAACDSTGCFPWRIPF
jgi:hypothetical protein